MSALAKSLRKVVQKSAESSLTLHEGFNELDQWVSTGNHAMNKLLSGSYHKGFPFSKTVAIAGESGSGKSLIAAVAAADAQRQHKALVVWIDAEYASREAWLQALGVDTSEEGFLYLNAGTIGDVKSIIADVVKELRKQPENKRQPVYIVIDSYGALLTEADWEKAQKGEQGGDMGQGAKQKKELLLAITHLIGRLPIAVVGMVHSMASTDKYSPDDVITGGRGIQYMASLILLFNKLKLKVGELEDGTFTDEEDDAKKVVGIRCKANVVKSRFAKPNEKVFVQVPWPHGVDRYSGLFDLMLGLGEIESPSIGWYQYTTKDGKETKFRRKEFRDHADAIINLSEKDQLKAPKRSARTAAEIEKEAKELEKAES
jgi:RecA/RadA recombinase